MIDADDPAGIGRRAIVTGGAGFIGSHVVARLIDNGVAVLVIDDLSTGRLEQVHPGAEFAQEDLLEADLERLLGQWQADVVFHLAAQASVARSSRDPLRDLAVNVGATNRVAAASRAAGVRRLVFVSSGGAVYGDSRRPATERSMPAPMSFYGVHKLAAEGHVRLGGVSWAIARPSNVYGPNQRAGLEGAVVASFIDQARGPGSLEIHGDGRQTRDFLHVSDVVRALLLLGRIDGPNGTWNVASDRSVTIVELADLIERIARRPLPRTFGPRRTGDVRHSAVSAGRLRELGWRPEVSLEEGVAELFRR